MNAIVTQTIEEAVDQLGVLKAQIKALEDRAEELRGLLVIESETTKLSNFDGDLFHANVSFSDKENTCWKQVVELLRDHVSNAVVDAIIDRCTEVTTHVATVKVSAHKTK